MRRRILIALFALGTIGGYGSAIAGARCNNAPHASWWSQCGESAAPKAAPQDDAR
jgi:hypothetical protein